MYFHTLCALVWIWNAGLKCAARGSMKIQDAKTLPKISHLVTIAQLCWAISSQLRHVSTIGKTVKQQYLLQMFLQYGELRSVSGWDRFTSLGNPANFNRFRVLASLLQRCRWPETNQTLHDVWPSSGLVHYIYILEGFCPWQNFGRCKVHFASKCCVLLYWQPYCTALQQGVSAKLSGVVQGMELQNFRIRRHLFGWAAITLGMSPHSSLPLF